MFDQGSSSGPPQFGTAEYKGAPAPDTCKLCGQYISGTYYRANKAMVCPACADRIRREVPQDSHAAFVRALIFGIGGFVAGLALYAGFTIVTSIQIGYVSLAVGWLVGKAMMLGSRGMGGRRYQIAAVLLTYAAVSMAAIPIAIWVVTHQTSQTQKQSAPPAPSSPGSPSSSDAGQSQPAPNQDSDEQARPRRSLGELVWRLIYVGLASPFLELEDEPSGAIGLVILLVGMRFAWRMTAGSVKVGVDGPFDNSKATATT